MRNLSRVAPEWWDYTTLDEEVLQAVARLTPEKLRRLSRPGFQVVVYDTLEDFYLAEALEYITAWKQATPERPAGICGPIGPTEQLPLVARLVNELEINLRHAHFWAMDEWVVDGQAVPATVCLGPRRANRWTLPAVQQPELYSGLIDPQGHLPAQSIDLAYELALGKPPDRGVTGHLRNGVQIGGKEEGRKPQA